MKKKIYDITRELFSSEIYPGDPVPVKKKVMSLEKEEPDICQLSKLTMGSHTGTHMDAPRHFFKDAKGIDEVELYKCIGRCKVVTLEKGQNLDGILQDGNERVLIRGEYELTEKQAADIISRDIVLVGTEGLSIAPISNPVAIHRMLLEHEIVIVEGIDLSKVEDGDYEIIAMPLKMKGLDGSPSRIVLREL